MSSLLNGLRTYKCNMTVFCVYFVHYIKMMYIYTSTYIILCCKIVTLITEYSSVKLSFRKC